MPAFEVSTAEQGTEQWFIDRLGYVTASNMEAVMAKGQGVTRNKYLVKTACEILTGRPTTNSFKSKYMQAGNDNEPKARALYTAVTGNDVRQVGFCFIRSEKLGASLDGEIIQDDDGIMEIKNVIATEQVDLITTGKIKPRYIKQMQTQMYVKRKQWCDFTSVCFGDEENGYLPDEHKIKIIRVYRDEDIIREIRKETAFFIHDLNQLLSKLGGTK